MIRPARMRRFEALESRRLMSVSPQEQLFVYLLNRARHDPQAYEQEANLPVSLASVPARPPLAANGDLFDSAEFHAQEMATFNYFSHQSNVTGDWPNKMVRDQGYALESSFPNNSNQVESIAAGTFYTNAAVVLRELIIDEGVPSLGHRNHLLGIDSFNANNREIGVGFASNNSTTFTNYWAIHATRSSPTNQFLTGVVFNDTNGNSRYDAGEGLSGVTVQANNLTTTTNAAGGWSIAAPNGQYTVRASGGAFAGTGSVTVNMAGENIEVDFLSGLSSGYVDFQLQQGSVDSFGLFVSTHSTFFLKYSNTPGPADATIGFGPAGAGWIPLGGDWNGDGRDTFGLYEPNSSTFFLRNVNAPGAADQIVQFGPSGAGWLPVVGDWDGNGTTTVGLYSSATSTFYFKNSHASGAADGIVQFGPAGSGWMPLAGDWDGNGTDTFALFASASSSFFYKNTNGPGPADAIVQFGPAGAGWKPLAGDFNGNQFDTFGLYAPATSVFYFKNSLGPGPAEGIISFGPAGSGWTPLVGKWNAPVSALAGPTDPALLTGTGPSALASISVDDELLYDRALAAPLEWRYDTAPVSRMTSRAHLAPPSRQTVASDAANEQVHALALEDWFDEPGDDWASL